ncbi:hypothetical protein Scep_026643 [Stephania cephalantha]|uniref:Uncharacterized protein n=1 Tax=Stephania cephalantha TaxID=152367 RepID=A0AAP0HQL9_9MAGN
MDEYTTMVQEDVQEDVFVAAYCIFFPFLQVFAQSRLFRPCRTKTWKKVSVYGGRN